MTFPLRLLHGEQYKNTILLTKLILPDFPTFYWSSFRGEGHRKNVFNKFFGDLGLGLLIVHEKFDGKFCVIKLNEPRDINRGL